MGTQYRSVIYTHDEEQERIAKQELADAQSLFDNPIVTEVQPFSAFYQAEEYHQDYYAKNPEAGYCRVVIEPKLVKFRQQLSSKLR